MIYVDVFSDSDGLGASVCRPDFLETFVSGAAVFHARRSKVDVGGNWCCQHGEVAKIVKRAVNAYANPEPLVISRGETQQWFAGKSPLYNPHDGGRPTEY